MKNNKMKVNEIFYSIQGEGRHSGTPAIFVRFSGCNLNCYFCDTQHETYVEYTEEELIGKIISLSNNVRLVIITGGEPALQLTQSFVDKLHSLDYYVAVETNGTMKLPKVDWITMSPKHFYINDAKPILDHVNEVKIVVDENFDFSKIQIPKLIANYFYIQPCDTGDKEKNNKIIKKCVDWIKANPNWRLSLQVQKIINVK